MINKLKKNRRLLVLIVFAICLSMGFMKPVFAQENSLTVRLQAHLSVLADAKKSPPREVYRFKLETLNEKKEAIAEDVVETAVENEGYVSSRI